MSDNLNLTQKIRTVEWLKSEMLLSAGELYRKMAMNEDTKDIAEALAHIILSAYMLGTNLGISPAAVDMKITDTIKQNTTDKNELTDVDSLYRYISSVRAQ